MARVIIKGQYKPHVEITPTVDGGLQIVPLGNPERTIILDDASTCTILIQTDCLAFIMEPHEIGSFPLRSEIPVSKKPE